MDIYDNLRFELEKPLWSKAPAFLVIDIILVNNPHIIDIVKSDVLAGLKNNGMGRGDVPTVEQILRAAIYKDLRKLTYEDLVLHQYDSRICGEFLHLTKAFSKSTLQGYISKIGATSLEKIMVEINKIGHIVYNN